MLGVIREYAFSHFFGATPLLSSFTVAFQVPNLARKLFGEGALTSSFIPILTRTREAHGDGEAGKFAGAILTLLSTVLTVLLILTEAGLLITSRFTWGPTLSLTALLMPFMVLICVTAFFGGVLNTINRFAAPAIAPMLLNVIIISATWVGGAWLNLEERAHFTLIASGILVAGALQVALQMVWLKAAGFRVTLNWDWSSPAVRKVMTLMAPMILGLSAVQLNTLADTFIAFFMVEDGRGPAVLRYAQYMSNLPLGIFSTALATAIFPLLSQRAARNDGRGFADAVETGLRAALYIAIPAGIGLILIAKPMVQLLFEHGEFTSSDTTRVSQALSCYCLALWAYSAQQIIVRAFYSQQESKTPVRIGLVSLGLNLVLNVVLVIRYGEMGVALATAVSGSVQAIALGIAFSRRLPGLKWRIVGSTGLRSIVASMLMTIAVVVTRSLLDTSTWAGFLSTVGVGIVTYAIASRALKLEEMKVLLGGRSGQSVRR